MFDWLVYPALIIGIVIFYGLVGLPFAAVLARRSRVLLCLAPVFGLSILAIAGSWFSLLERPMNRSALVLVTAALTAGGLAILLRDYRQRLTLNPGRSAREQGTVISRLAAIVIAPWVIGLVAVTIFIMPIITMGLLEGGFVTSFTSLNNDLASYILLATNLQEAGFGPTELLVDQDLPGLGSLGDLARYDHTGATSLLASTSLMFGLPVWKIASVTVLVVTVSVTPAAYVFAYQILRIRLRWCLVAACVGSLTIYLWYITAQFFFAQIIAIVLVLGQMALFSRAARVHRFWPAAALAPVIIAAGWFCSPEVELISIPLICAVALVGLLQRPDVNLRGWTLRFVRSYCALLVWVAVAVAASLVLAIPRIKGAIEVLSSVGKDNIAGWTLNLFGSGAALVGIDGRSDPADPNIQLQGVTGVDWISWLLIVLLLVGLVTLSIARKDRRAGIGLLLIAALLLLGGYGVVRWGGSGYQTWKLLVTLSFATLTLIAATWLRLLRTGGARQFVLAALMTAVGMSIVNGQHAWDPNLSSPTAMRSRIINPELVALLRSPFLQRQEGANMRLQGMFETMAAPAVYDRSAEMSGPHYFGSDNPDGQGYPFPCTVMSKGVEKSPQLVGTRVVRQTENYVVLGTKDCK